jgi:hypothetical protein
MDRSVSGMMSFVGFHQVLRPGAVNGVRRVKGGC